MRWRMLKQWKWELQDIPLVLSSFEPIIPPLCWWLILSCLCPTLSTISNHFSSTHCSVFPFQHIHIHHSFSICDRVKVCPQLSLYFPGPTKLSFHSCTSRWNCRKLLLLLCRDGGVLAPTMFARSRETVVCH